MTFWEIGTWLAIAVLGPGALLVFVLFLRDARRIPGGPGNAGSGERKGEG